MLYIFMLMMTFISLSILFVSHPLLMGMLILIQTLLLSLTLGIFINTYWFSYILFLVFLGGLLVLFIYVSSMASNELMKFTLKMKMSLFFSLFLIVAMSLMINKTYFMEIFMNNEMNNFLNFFLFFNENKIMLSKLYNKQTFFLIIMIIIYLFITLIAIIKITNIFFGPLRSFN